LNPSILSQLSSQVGDRTEVSNRKVVQQCLENHHLITEIAAGLKQPEAALVGDCAEVLTQVAQENPALVVPYADSLSVLLMHKNSRVRWEVTHALALIATSSPASITPLVPILVQLNRNDASVIVRDHATDTLANYAYTGKAAAECVYPYLVEMLTLWDGKQAGHALMGLASAAPLLPSHRDELRAIASGFSASDRSVVRKAAKKLLKAVGSQSTA
jgi:HEAT repeat protein